jgi:hypothetical protein
MADNGISTLATKELRQIAKLDLASADRLAVSNPRAYYDITQLPTQYSDNDIVDNPNTDGLIEGRPWIEIPPTPSYALEFRAVIGEGEPGDIITTCNEGDVIWFSIIGTNLPDDPTAYLQFSGATITNADGSEFAEVPINLVDPIPYPITGTVTNGAYLTIEADNLTEGNETLTLDWIVNSTTVATASISIVDTSTGTLVTSGLRLYLDAGNATSYTSGTTWTDLSTNTNNATLVGSPAFTSAGTSSYFTVNGTGNQYANTDYTKYSGTYTGKTTFFVARISSSMNNGYHGIFGVGPGPTRTFNTYIYKTPGPNYQIHASFVPGSGFSNNLTVSAGQWFTFGATHDSSGNITLYFNGQAVGVTTGQTFTNTYSSGTYPQLIGKTDNFWHGDIAVVTVYDSALSGAEMTQNHNSILGRYGL